MFNILVLICLLNIAFGRRLAHNSDEKCLDGDSQACKEESKDGLTTTFYHSELDHTENLGDTKTPSNLKDRDRCSNWSYPSTSWPTICPKYCDGTRQSPIDIVFRDNFFEFQKFTYNNYLHPISSVNIKNNGHSASISWDTSVNTPSISGGGLGYDYTLAKFHFHWCCVNSLGSEHRLYGQSYAMEMHLVHYKTSYGSLAEAIKHSDGLAVLGVFFVVGAENPGLKPITDNLSQITKPGTDKDIPFNVAIGDLLPSNNQTFYRYLGSLTTPTCNEVVVWTVFQDHVEVSQAQLDAFRSMEDKNHVPLCPNFREVQPLNDRKISLFNPGLDRSSSPLTY